MEEKILVVDDEKSIADVIAYAFRREGYTVEKAYDGSSALNKISSFKPNLVILDVMMPHMKGFDVCKKLSSRNDMGIILLTAKDDIVDKVLGLELGADDYEITIKSLKLIPRQRRVILEGQCLELKPKEFDLLALLLSSQGRVYTREELLDIVWGDRVCRGDAYCGYSRAKA
ncbi:Transcriptional regulatory protein, C terminal [Peptoclostridium litorale DSM 5388]|uniref:Stage 0 sporulation protein A homolog n=1 Tax=Peptoclostridium litorale DSM 5388 TaxID=1121324 RepID=A0A069REG9_PEPLI|nr:response regulator transcription factor [Peptoclostridium litorale]KDR95464.1 Two-component response regulator PhoP [Peptoclostridium litorale DSM 5388]SIO18150.1 Transcriptional regulatory protein, C terminal [Peptoclostridium litorale DSM 5388]